MFKVKQVSSIIKCKQIYTLFIFFVLSFQSVVGQSSFEVNTLDIIQSDSLGQIENVKDSIYSPFSSQAYNLDSLVDVMTVSDNDFISWVTTANVLFGSSQEIDPITVNLKFHRPVWILITILILFIAIGLVRIFFYNNFYNIIFGFYNDRVLTQINKEDSILTSWPYIFLYTIFTFSLGLFITLYQSYVLYQDRVEFADFMKISVGIALLFLLKIIFVRLVGVLFEIEKLVREYIVFLYLFYFNSVLVLMPLLLLITFVPTFYFNYILFFLISIVSILFIYRFFKTILNLIAGLRFSMFYLILYLCTLEIAPILLLVKSLNN